MNGEGRTGGGDEMGKRGGEERMDGRGWESEERSGVERKGKGRLQMRLEGRGS